MFRFGGRDEIERNVKVEESSADASSVNVDVAEVSGKIENESSQVLKEEVKYNYSKIETDPVNLVDHCIEGDSSSVLTSGSEFVEALSDGKFESNERLLEDTAFDVKSSDLPGALLGYQTNVHPEDASNGEILGSVTVSNRDDVKQDENSNTFVSDSKGNAEESVEVLRDHGVGETTQFSASGSESEIEPPNNHASQKSNQEITHVNTPAKDDKVDTELNHGAGEDAMEGNVTEVVDKTYVLKTLEADPVLDDKTTHNTVDEFVDTHGSMSSKMVSLALLVF